VSGSEFDNLQRTLGPSHKPSRVRGNTPVISAAFKAFCAEKQSAGACKGVDPDEGRKFNVCLWLHDSSPAVVK